MKRLTPVLYVDEVESALRFWVDALGFEKTAEVREGDRIGFVALSRDSVEVMYQSRSSLERESPALADYCAPAPTALYVEVDDLDDTVRRLPGFEVVVPMHRTPYGATALAVREPAGNIVMFAQLD